jgi:hypothetical protein
MKVKDEFGKSRYRAAHCKTNPGDLSDPGKEPKQWG